METSSSTGITALHERLRVAAGSRTYRQLGDLTNTNHETVRRYMLGQAPSAEFLAAACSALAINAQWLLIGHGPMKSSDIRTHALGEANVSELLNAMSATLERLMDRVDRLETYMQTLETHLRAQAGDDDALSQNPGASTLLWAKNHPTPDNPAPDRGSHHGPATTLQPIIEPHKGTSSRVAGVLDAVTKRPRASAD